MKPIGPLVWFDCEDLDRDDPQFHDRYLVPAMAVLSNKAGRMIGDGDIWIEQFAARPRFCVGIVQGKEP